MTFSKKSTISIALFIALVLIVYNYICRSYYQGTPGFDGPLLSYLMYHNTYEPYFVPNGGPYYQTHLSIIFALFSALSYLLPFNRIEYFGFINGIFVGLSGVITYLFLCKYYKISRKGSVAVGLFLAMNGITLQVLYYHHFEAWIPILIIAFLYCWHEKKHALAYLSFILLLLVREDAGFHYFGLVFLMIAYSYWQSKRSDKQLIFLGIAAFTYSALALWIQKYFYPGDKAFARMYIDFSQPNPFEHVSIQTILVRLQYTAVRCAYLSVPIILQVYYVCSKRWPAHTLIGLLSCAPWIIISILSKNQYGLMSYYSFPLIIIFFWPFFSCVYFEKHDTTKMLRFSILKWQSLVIIASTVLAADILFKICKINTTTDVENVKLFQQELITNKHKLEGLYATIGILGLDPTIDSTQSNPKTVIYNINSKWKCSSACNNPNLNHFYRINKTNIRIATIYDLAQLSLFSNLKVERYYDALNQ